jgi:hypothetical protein
MLQKVSVPRNETKEVIMLLEVLCFFVQHTHIHPHEFYVTLLVLSAIVHERCQNPRITEGRILLEFARGFLKLQRKSHGDLTKK